MPTCVGEPGSVLALAFMRTWILPTGRLFWVSVAWALTAGCTLLHRGASDLRSGDTVKIDEIIKGDEVVVEKDGGHFRVRMLGVQAQDAVIADAYLEKAAKAATDYLADLRGKPIQVFFEATVRDTHGRYLAYLQANDADLNRQMVQAGLVVVYTEYAFGREKAYLEAETAARQQHQGIWGTEKTQALIAGLRKQWKEARHTRGDKPPSDPLL